jgi:tetratricopeptide (TPR) repeat protein
MAEQSRSGKGSSNESAKPESANLSSALELLGQMESHVGGITYARPSQAAASSAADEELRHLREELLSADQRGYDQLASFVRALEDLKLAIPSLIDEAVNARFLEIEEQFHRNVKEIHSRSIDAFTQSVQSKIGQRVSALESDLSLHTEAMGQLREHYLKTDRNVQRLMTGLDRLTAELFRLSANANSNFPRTIFGAPSARPDRPEPRIERPERPEPRVRPSPAPAAAVDRVPDEDSAADSDPKTRERRSARRERLKRRRRSAAIVALLLLIVVVPVGLVGWSIYHSGGGLSALRGKPAETATAEAPLTGIAAQMKLAADYTNEKNYGKAESAYRLILKSDPNNREAIKSLASVLFRQQHYDEAAAVLKTLTPE